MRIKVKSFVIVFLLAVVLLSMSLSTGTPARASGAAVNKFYAGCRFFSIDVVVHGVTDDGGGFDRFLYLVTDGDNRVLYEEEAVRQVNVADRSSAVNLFYGIDGSINGVPAKNPIKFTVIDLDYLNKPSRNVIEAAYNADCLSASSVTNSPANFLDLAKGTGLIKDFTHLYYAPGADHPTDKKVLPGMKMSAVYRSADSNWISVLVSPQDMVWVPAPVIDINPYDLPIQPVRIDRSQQVTGAVPPPTAGMVGRVYGTLRIRALPTTASAQIGRVPYRAFVGVYGRNERGTWVKINYNGVIGWVLGAYVRLQPPSNGAIISLRIRDLPIVQ
jgi:hypothetical protein